MLVVLYDDFRRDNVGVVRSVFRFLEVSEGASVAPVEANPTVQLRSRRLDDLVLSVAVGRGAVTQRMQASIKALTWQSARRRPLTPCGAASCTASLARRIRTLHAPCVAASERR